MVASRETEQTIQQMIGRATYNGKTHLERNMGPGATVDVLINFRDWDYINDYIRFQDEVADK